MITAHSAIYRQSTGEFCILSPVDDGVERVVFSVFGYAGNGKGRNNPDAEKIRNVGPLPKGLYTVTGPFTDAHAGALVFRLWPHVGNDMHGRSGFLIHGDNPQGDASRGCVILSKAARREIYRHAVRSLRVVG